MERTQDLLRGMVVQPHHTTPRHTTPHYTTPHHATLHHATPRHTTPHHTTPHHATPRHTTPHHTTPHHTTPHHTNPKQIIFLLTPQNQHPILPPPLPSFSPPTPPHHTFLKRLTRGCEGGWGEWGRHVTRVWHSDVRKGSMQWCRLNNIDLMTSQHSC